MPKHKHRFSTSETTNEPTLQLQRLIGTKIQNHNQMYTEHIHQNSKLEDHN